MKLEQVIFMIIMVNLLNIFVGLVIEAETIDNVHSNIIDRMNGNNGFLGYIEAGGVIETLRNADMWGSKFAGEVLQGLANAINTVIIGFKIIGIILWGWITPFKTVVGSSMTEGVTLLRFIGFMALIYINWFNIMAVTKLYRFLKGSDQ